MANPQYVTLVANTVSTLTLDKATFDRVEVYVVTASAASDPVYFTVDGSTPAVATNGSNVVGGTAGSAVVLPNLAVTATVKLKSAGAPTVQVRGI